MIAWLWIGIGILIGWLVMLVIITLKFVRSIEYMTRPVTPEEQTALREAMDEGI